MYINGKSEPWSGAGTWGQGMYGLGPRFPVAIINQADMINSHLYSSK